MRKKLKEVPKLNLIPILDAVFIFIFFLLMSAQFLDIYEIGTDAPAISEIEEDKDKTLPLNLTLTITKENIIVKKGMTPKTIATIKKDGGSYNYKKLKKILKRVKVKNIDEVKIILKPMGHIPYNTIVKIMDSVRSIGPSETPLTAKNKKGKTIKTRELFNQVIFETVI